MKNRGWCFPVFERKPAALCSGGFRSSCQFTRAGDMGSRATMSQPNFCVKQQAQLTRILPWHCLGVPGSGTANGPRSKLSAFLGSYYHKMSLLLKLIHSTSKLPCITYSLTTIGYLLDVFLYLLWSVFPLLFEARTGNQSFIDKSSVGS